MDIDNPMHATKAGEGRVEGFVRGVLAFVLLVAVAWAYAQGAPA